MAYCENCGTEMSDAATACPSCGHPVGAVSGYGAAGPYATFGRRFLGWLIDAIIANAIGFLFARRGGYGGFAIGFFYNWLMLAFNDGRTVGKMALGIRIARPDGSRIDVGTAAARSAMAIVSGLAIGLGYLWAAWDQEKRTWHDMVANTRAFDVSR